jgi:hypothetical protein|tara:strand:- start:541 stop:1041 length:501 start_codon:yes stop_codon:yes gene_type:complete
MGTLTIPNSFSAGTTIVANDMNANFTAVKNYVEGDVLQESTATAKGDIYVASSSGVVTKLSVGTNDHVLTADSSEATGLKWAAAPADATKMPLAGGTFTGAVTFDGASPIILEGATANDYETTITVTDPTADRTLTLPDATGTVALTSDIPGNSVADSIISNQVFS